MGKKMIVFKPKRIILDLPLAALLGVQLLSVVFSSDKPASLFGSYGRWYEGFLVSVFFILASRILAENIQLPRSAPFLEQGLRRWLLLSLPLFLLAGLLFWSGSVFSYSTGFAVVSHTLFESPKSLLLGSGPGTFFIDKQLYGTFGKEAALPWFGELLATTGVLGAGAFAAVWGIALYGALVLFQKRKDRVLASFAFGMIGTSVMASLLLPMSLPLLLFSWGAFAFSMIFLKGEKQYEFSRAVSRFCIPVIGILLVAVFLSGFFMGGAGEWWRYRSLSYSDRLQYLQKAVQFNPLDPGYRIDLSKLYLERFLQEYAKPSSLQNPQYLQENIRLATESARTAVSLAPNRAAAWEALGVVYREIQSVSGATDFAIQSFEKAVSLEPFNPRFHTELGKLYAASQDSEKAREQFEKAIELDPFFTPASIEMALLLEKEGKGEEALTLMEQLALRSPDNLVLVQLGRMYYNAKRYADAVAQFERALSYKETDSNARYALALSYEALGDNQRAIQELEKVLQLNPDSKEVQQKINSLQQKNNSLKSFQ